MVVLSAIASSPEEIGCTWDSSCRNSFHGTSVLQRERKKNTKRLKNSRSLEGIARWRFNPGNFFNRREKKRITLITSIWHSRRWSNFPSDEKRKEKKKNFHLLFLLRLFRSLTQRKTTLSHTHPHHRNGWRRRGSSAALSSAITINSRKDSSSARFEPGRRGRAKPYTKYLLKYVLKGKVAGCECERKRGKFFFASFSIFSKIITHFNGKCLMADGQKQLP